MSQQKTPKPTTQPPNRWQFIDLSQDNAENLTQVKRHVMQEYMRQKRMENQQQDGSDEGTDNGRKTSKKTSRRSKAKATKELNSAVQSQRKPAAVVGRRSREEGAALRIVPVRRGSSHQHQHSDYSDLSSSSQHSSTLSSPPYSSSASSLYLDPSSDGDQYGLDFGAGFQNAPHLPTWSAMSTPPRTVLSAARTDPFDTLPWHATREDQRLFDFYVNEMPAVSYGHHFRTRKAHNWYTEVFVPEAMKGALTFVNTVLVHAANTWAWVRNENETDSTLRYRQLAISMLRDHIQKYPLDSTDNVITACMSAAALEDFDPRPGHKEVSWIHMRQARKLIRRRGGPSAFNDTKLAMLINWQDYILAGYVSDPDGFYYEDDHPFSDTARTFSNGLSINFLPSPPNSASPATQDRTPSPTYYPSTQTAEEEIALQCEYFLGFLARCEHLAVTQRIVLTSRNAPVRYSAFGSGSTLHRILASPAEKRRTVTGDRKQFIARLAALMMLNTALWDYRSSVSKTEAFLEHTIRQLQESEVNVGSSIEALLQILLACKDFLHDDLFPLALDLLPPSSSGTAFSDLSHHLEPAVSPFARPWFVGRMLKVAKRLGLQSWLRLNNFLYDCLTFQIQEHTVLAWSHELRREILQAPLTSYVMPALQEAVFLGT